MNFPLKNFMNNEELKEILKRAIQRTNKYNLSNDFEIKQLKSIILERTNQLPEGTSLSKRIYAFLSDFENCRCKICGTIHTKNNEFCSTKCRIKNTAIELERRTNENRISNVIENGENKYKNKQEGYDYVVCQICGCKCGSLEGHLKIHNITGNEYKERFNIRSLKSQRLIDSVSGENNPGFQHNRKIECLE